MNITELARAAGVHPLAYSEEYLPGLLRFAAAFREESAAHIYRLREEIMQQENEMYLMRQQNERLSLDGIHTCHSECQRPVCRLTRERDALLERADTLQRWYDQQLDRLAAVEAQRDALLEALRKIGRYTGEGSMYSTPWQDIVADLGQTARAAIKAVEENT